MTMLTVPEVPREAFTTISPLGEGAFAVVSLVKGSAVKGCGFGPTQESRCGLRSRNRGNEYAMKELHSDLKNSEVAIASLMNEVKILSSLPAHENVITLHAVSEKFEKSTQNAFLVLDLVAETLEERLYRWRVRRSAAMSHNPTKSFWGTKKSRKVSEQLGRMGEIPAGIAHALHFLHAHGVIHRDLKPANIGIAFDGTVRLLDFGLARRLDDGDNEHGRLTGCTGTIRYMAPEVALHQDYGASADVYSFGMLLWELVTLKIPFAHIKGKQKYIRTISKSRPSLRSVASIQARKFIASCWHPVPLKRPSFSTVCIKLQQIHQTDEFLI